MNSKIKYDEGKIEILSKSGMDSGVIISTKSKYLPDVLNRLPLPKDSDCRFFVDLYLKAENYNNVFIIGEKSACLDLSEKCQPNSIGLKIQAKICANNIISMINNNPLKPLNQKTFVEFMPIGYRNCLITIKDFSFDGLLAWLLFRIIHLSTYIGIKSKVSAFLKLLFSLINPVDTDIFLLEEISEYKREKITV
jgi:NADH dehydrogenase FAD-containing subunit